MATNRAKARRPNAGHLPLVEANVGLGFAGIAGKLFYARQQILPEAG